MYEAVESCIKRVRYGHTESPQSIPLSATCHGSVLHAAFSIHGEVPFHLLVLLKEGIRMCITLPMAVQARFSMPLCYPWRWTDSHTLRGRILTFVWTFASFSGPVYMVGVSKVSSFSSRGKHGNSSMVENWVSFILYTDISPSWIWLARRRELDKLTWRTV